MKKIKNEYEVLWYCNGEYETLDIDTKGKTPNQIKRAVFKEIRKGHIIELTKNQLNEILNEQIHFNPCNTMKFFKELK